MVSDFSHPRVGDDIGRCIRMMNKLKTALVLTIIGIVSGLLIFGTNELTEDGIIEIRAERERSYYREIFGLDADDIIAYDTADLTDGLANEYTIYDGEGAILGYIYKGEDTNSYGSITVLVGIRLDGTISSVVISNTTNTPIFVKKIETDYLFPFVGQDTADVAFDAKTGASYTYGSVSEIVDLAATYYQENRGGDND